MVIFSSKKQTYYHNKSVTTKTSKLPDIVRNYFPYLNWQEQLDNTHQLQVTSPYSEGQKLFPDLLNYVNHTVEEQTVNGAWHLKETFQLEFDFSSTKIIKVPHPNSAQALKGEQMTFDSGEFQDLKDKSETFFNGLFKTGSFQDKLFYESTFQSGPSQDFSTVPNYNFLIKKYEQLIANKSDIAATDPELNVLSHMLPNLYIFASLEENDILNNVVSPLSEDYKFFNKFITLGELIKNKDAFSEKGSKKQVKDLGLYFNNWSRKIEDIIFGKIPPINGIPAHQIYKDWKSNSNRMRNLIIPASDVFKLQKYNNKKYLFPMHVDITIPADQGSHAFTKILLDSKLVRGFTGEIFEIGDSPSYETNYQTGYVLSVDTNLDTTGYETSAKNDTPLPVKDVSSWVYDISEHEFSTELPSDGVFLGGNFESEIKKENNFIKNMFFLIFKDKLKKYVKERLRTHKTLITDFLNNPASSETVMYRVEKRDLNGGPPQNIYIPVTLENKIMEYIDTQVKYKTDYTYQIFEYKLVVGNKYRYNTLDGESVSVGIDPADKSLISVRLPKVEVINTPSLLLYEIPKEKHTVRVLDAPPVAPEIEFIPIKDSKNKIKINLQSNTGAYILEPITIYPEDAELFNFPLVEEDPDKILFKSDEGTKRYEVLRLDFKPESIKDFSLVKPYAIKDGQAALIDTLKPNTKYYYVFRAVDFHDHVSNPTPVYEVEIIKNSGAIYPIVQLVNFEDPIPRKKQKQMKTLIQIAPTFEQSLIQDNFENTATISSQKPSLGDVFSENKRFKIRFTSRATGRKFDLNIKCALEHEN